MRIAWVVPGGVDRSGEVRVLPWLLWQLERIAARHDLLVVALNQYREPCSYTLLGARVENVGGGRQSLLRVVPALVAAGPFGAIHAFWGGAPACAAAVAARWMRCSLIVSLFGGELVAIEDIGYGAARHWRGRASVRASLALADRITVASGPMEALVRRTGRVAARVPFGVDRRYFRPSSAKPDGPPWKLLHIASLNRVKDQGTLLRAIRRVVDLGSNVELDVVGEDTLGGETQALAHALGLSTRVRFHGFQTSRDLVPFYQNAHLFTLSSRHEGGGVVVLEAAACGVPTVGTLVGHIVDLAPDGACGVPVANPEALARGLERMLADADARQRLGAAANAWAGEHDADWTAQQLDRLYREVSGTS